MTAMTRQKAANAQGFPWLRRFTKLVVIATLALIFIGGQVKSHDAGLSVPDWPTSYGWNMFLYPVSEWDGGIFYEQTHRLAASCVGALSLVLCGWLFFRESRRWVKVLGCFAVVGVIAQGVLGGLTVLFVQPAWLSSLHGVVAQSFLILIIVIAYTQSRERARRTQDFSATAPRTSAKPLLLVIGIVFTQLIVGALMRHTESGLAIPDFPLMAGGMLPWFTAESVEWVDAWRVDYAFETGKVLPEITLSQIWVHFAHRAGAIVVTLSILHALVQTFKNRAVSRDLWTGALILAGLVAVQLSLGITTVLTQKIPVVTSLHVATGAAILGYATLLALRALPLTLESRGSTGTVSVSSAILTQKVQT